MNREEARAAALSVAVVDDDRVFRFLARKALERLPWPLQLSFYEDGYWIMRHIQQHEAQPEALPDLIFLDINMPVLGGWEFMQALRKFSGQLPKPIRIVIISSSINAKDEALAAQYAEIIGYWIKPITAEQYAEFLQALIPAV